MSKWGIISRAASLLVAGFYLLRAVQDGEATVALLVMLCLALAIPLGLIWFPDRISDVTGFTDLATVHPDTPPFLVTFMGWVFLIGFPLLIAVLASSK
jgi:hypothetical protein